MFFKPLPGLAGLLDVSLEDLPSWSSLPPNTAECVDSILNMIRIRVKADPELCTLKPPPATSKEREWREWIRKTVPRAIFDVLRFIEIHSGNSIDYHAASSFFQMGFKDSLKDAFAFGGGGGSFQSVADFAKGGRGSIIGTFSEATNVDFSFVIRVIQALEPFDTKKKFQRIVARSRTSSMPEPDGGDEKLHAENGVK